jgi:hypothetical protein
MAKKPDDQFTPEESQKRFEAALKGARVAGPKPKSDVPAKRPGARKVASRKKK